MILPMKRMVGRGGAGCLKRRRQKKNQNIPSLHSTKKVFELEVGKRDNYLVTFSCRT